MLKSSVKRRPRPEAAEAIDLEVKAAAPLLAPSFAAILGNFLSGSSHEYGTQIFTQTQEKLT